MNILYVYAHPHSTSLNGFIKQHALAQLARLHSKTQLSDLYDEKFQFTDNINIELEKIAWADHMIFQFPLWWFSMPAILKDWFDRSFLKGFAYDTGKTFDKGLLKGKTASLTITTQSPEAAYQKNGQHAATIEDFLLPIHHTLRFVGITSLKPFIIHGAFDLNTEQANMIVKEYADYLQQLVSKNIISIY
jgi:putative NADPH-quinone reductase